MKKSILEKKLRNTPRLRILRKQENRNQLNQYCKLMNYCLEIGFFYVEARKYVPTMLKEKMKVQLIK